MLQRTAAAQAKGGVQAPRFEVDPMWPKPLPNHWVLGNVIGVGVDTKDHVCIIHRGAGSLEREGDLRHDQPAVVRVLRAGAAGARVRLRPATSCSAWGGPGQGYEWPESNHGITLDYKGNVWIGGNGAQRRPRS